MTPEQAYEQIASSNLELHNYLQTQQIKIQNTIDPQLIQTILQDPQYTYFYIKTFLKERWPKGEQTILQSPVYTYNYITEFLKERWPQGEQTIINSQDPQLIRPYQEWLKNQRKKKKRQKPT